MVTVANADVVEEVINVFKALLQDFGRLSAAQSPPDERGLFLG